jgi:hypothetical protein
MAPVLEDVYCTDPQLLMSDSYLPGTSEPLTPELIFVLTSHLKMDELAADCTCQVPPFSPIHYAMPARRRSLP